MQIVLSQWSPMGNHPPSPFLLTNQKGNVRVWLLILGGKETEILGFLHDSVHQRKFFFSFFSEDRCGNFRTSCGQIQEQ